MKAQGSHWNFMGKKSKYNAAKNGVVNLQTRFFLVRPECIFFKTDLSISIKIQGHVIVLHTFPVVNMNVTMSHENLNKNSCIYSGI